MARITVDPGTTIHCYVDDYLWPWDKSTPVVMLHGFARNGNFWRPWVPYVSATRRVYRPEIRGFGKSDVPPEDYTFDLAVVVDDFAKVLDQSGIERAHFAGESSGGVLSMLFAIAHPDRVASLVLCDTPIRPPDAVRAIYALGEKNGAAAMMKYGVGEWCRRTLEYRLDVEHASPELQDWVVNEMDTSPRHVAAAFHNALRESPSPASLIKQIKVPTLLLSGDKSKISAEQQQLLLKEMPQAKLHTFHGYGHCSNLVIPKECTDQAIPFWDGLEGLNGAGARSSQAGADRVS
jgi:3-oxoadipate enol-lactonase